MHSTSVSVYVFSIAMIVAGSASLIPQEVFADSRDRTVDRVEDRGDRVKKRF